MGEVTVPQFPLYFSCHSNPPPRLSLSQCKVQGAAPWHKNQSPQDSANLSVFHVCCQKALILFVIKYCVPSNCVIWWVMEGLLRCLCSVGGRESMTTGVGGEAWVGASLGLGRVPGGLFPLKAAESGFHSFPPWPLVFPVGCRVGGPAASELSQLSTALMFPSWSMLVGEKRAGLQGSPEPRPAEWQTPSGLATPPLIQS